MIDAGTVEGVVEIEVHRPAHAPKGWVFIEVPHGATRTQDYAALVKRLKSDLPKDLIHFFYVNTDIGAPEGAQWIGKTLATEGIGVVVARCLIPRTFIDTNRLITKSDGGKLVGGLTPAVPGYVGDAGDAAMLTVMHSVYHGVVSSAYARICGQAKGLALQLHSFAPKSVNIEKTDAGIVDALHAAYVPEVYATWPDRPAVDLICATDDGAFRSAPELHDALVAAYRDAGIRAEQNATYHLHPATMGLAYAKAHAGQVLCVELNRGRVADPFVPFGESPISAAKVEQMAAPIARVLQSSLSSVP